MAVSNLLRRLKNRFAPDRSQSSKLRTEPKLDRPAYFNRHPGRDFIVLGTGPSLKSRGSEIKRFIRDRDLISIGVNHIRPFMAPDYHGFTNRGRLKDFGSTIDPIKSRGLLSINFTPQQIERWVNAPYDLVMWRRAERPGIVIIDDKGVITHEGTAATLMILAAYAMGADQVYVAGMDGVGKLRSNGQAFHHSEVNYKAGTNQDRLDSKLDYWQHCNIVSLTAIDQWARDHDRPNLKFLTPTEYGDYHCPELLAGENDDRTGPA